MQRASVERPPVTELERVYREQGAKLFRALLLYSGDREIAADAVAEAFAQALRRADEIAAVDRWVWRTAYRVAAGELADRSARGTGPIERAYEISEAAPLLAIAMRDLSPKQRASVALHDYAGYTLRETARIIGSTPSAVSVHLVRAHAKLRRHLEGDA
jgi:RNA polymerase sigma-70 factor (ECF subfamily)